MPDHFDPDQEAEHEFAVASQDVRDRYLQDYLDEHNRRLQALLREGALPEEAGYRVATEMEEFRREQAAQMCDALLAVGADLLAREEQPA